MELAVALAESKGVTKDEAKADELFKLACEHNEVSACASLGWHVFKGIGAPKNEPEGTALLRKACDAKDVFGCQKLQEADKKQPAAKHQP